MRRGRAVRLQISNIRGDLAFWEDCIESRGPLSTRAREGFSPAWNRDGKFVAGFR